MEYKHTKGPWMAVFNKDTDNGANCSSVYSDDNEYVADVYSRYVGSENISKDEQQANARLIAAAPEMLEALERMLIEANDWDGPYEGARIQAKAAIAKATGETE